MMEKLSQSRDQRGVKTKCKLYPGLNPTTEQGGISGKIGEIQTKCIVQLIVSYINVNCSILTNVLWLGKLGERYGETFYTIFATFLKKDSLQLGKTFTYTVNK